MQPGKLHKLLWMGGTLTLAATGVFFLVQFFLFYHSKAEHAVEEGKRVIVAVDSGEIIIRSPELDTKEPKPATPATTPEPVAPTPAVPPAPAAEIYGPVQPTATAPTPEATAATTPAEATTTPTDAAPAKPVVYDGKARLAVIISGLGLNRAVTESVSKLPAGVTLSFSPYVSNLNNWVQALKKSGHEVLLDLPMETTDYPLYDPGPMAILNDAAKDKNIFRLNSVLAAAKDYVGVLASNDETITKSLVSILPVLDDLQKHKTLFIYNERPGNAFLKQEAGAIGLPIISHYVVVDDVLSAEAIDAKLEEVSAMILEEEKTVLVVGRPYPLTIKRIELWLKALKEKNGIEPNPVTTIINS